MSAVDQVHMARTRGKIEATIRGGSGHETRTFVGWGPALAFVNFATARNGAPEPTPPPTGYAEHRPKGSMIP